MDFFELLKNQNMRWGSELGLAMMLLSLTVSIRARNVLEIGRYKGYSTLALAQGLKYVDQGWQEHDQHKQRPDVNYSEFEGDQARRLVSLDPAPADDARDLLVTHNLIDYVELREIRSEQYSPDRQFDLIFIDGDHRYQAVLRDWRMCKRCARPGGYIIFHDYFGWYDQDGNNGSPVKRALEDIKQAENVESILIDTGYMSFMIVRHHG